MESRKRERSASRSPDRHRRERRNDKERRSSRSSTSMKCFNCGEPGHHVVNCPQGTKLTIPITQAGSGFSRTAKFSIEAAPKPDKDDAPMDDNEELKSRIKLLLIRVGEKVATLTTNLSQLVTALEDDAQTHCDFICDTLVKCAKALPSRTLIYATLVGLMQLSNPAFGQALVRKAVEELKTALANGVQEDVHLLVRFLAGLSSTRVTDTQSVLNLFNQLLDAAEDSENVATADVLLYHVMATLPWVGAHLASTSSVQLTQIMERLSKHVNNRSADSTKLFNNPLHRMQDLQTSLDCRFEDLLSSLWAAVKLCQTAEWHTEAIVRPYDHPDFQSQLKGGSAHTFSVSSIPSFASFASTVFPLRPDLRLYGSEEKIASIDRLIVSSFVSDTATSFDRLPKDAIKQLLGFPVKFEYLDILIETLAGCMLTLQRPRLPRLSYQVVIVDLLKAQPKLIPPLVGRGLNALFLALHTLDAEIRDAVAQWFSFHLSNFGYKWPWANWEAVVKQQNTAPQQCFVKEALAQCVGLSFWDRVRDTVPPSMQVLMPLERKPVFKYQKGSPGIEEEESTQLENLMERMRAKVSDVEVLSQLEQFPAEKRLSIFMNCLLLVGAKTFSHSHACFERYKGVTESLSKGSTASQLEILLALHQTWRTSSLHFSVLLDYLISLRMVSAACVLHWLFTLQSSFHQSWVWLVLLSCVNKTLYKMNYDLNSLSVKQQAAPDESTTKALVTLRLQKKQMFLMLFTKFSQALKLVSANELIFSWVEARFKQFVRTFELEIQFYLEDVQRIFEAADSKVGQVWSALSLAMQAASQR